MSKKKLWQLSEKLVERKSHAKDCQYSWHLHTEMKVQTYFGKQDRKSISTFFNFESKWKKQERSTVFPTQIKKNHQTHKWHVYGNLWNVVVAHTNNKFNLSPRDSSSSLNYSTRMRSAYLCRIKRQRGIRGRRRRTKEEMYYNINRGKH